MHAMPGHNITPMPLRSYVDRLVRLEEQKREIAADLKDVKTEAASVGFDKRVLAQMVKEAMMDSEQRAAQREFEEICEVYRADLGMLGGTPLGEAARKRAAARSATKPDVEEQNQGHEEVDEDERGDEEVSPDEGAMPEEDLDAAREKGRAAWRAGAKIFANPYTHGDPRRAAWDEAFCQENGSDGMDIPDAWRRRSKKKPGKGEPGGAP